MINRTLKYYNDNAIELSKKYNSITFNSIQEIITSYLDGAKKVLEVGCGSGRDANYMINNGFDVIGVDGSIEMLNNAEAKYPNLKGRLLKAILPNEFPSFEYKFDGAYSIATLMHFDKVDIDKILKKMHSVLKPDSPVYISISEKRNNADERYFIDFTKSDWVEVFQQNDFAINKIIETQGATNKEIVWFSFLLKTK